MRLAISGLPRGCAAFAALGSVAMIGACDKGVERIDLSRHVTIDPGPSIVEMRGAQAELFVAVRNVSPVVLRGLVLTAKSAACDARVTPARVERLIPGDRTRFRVQLARRTGAPRARETLALTLSGQGLPAAAGVDLIVDQQPGAARGWIDVGQVKLVRRPGGRGAYYVLAGLPLLFVVGWLLYRLTRRRIADAGESDP